MTQRFDRLRVLIVDDNAHMRSIISAILKGIGVHDIRDASDGTQALAILKEWPADLAIVDYRMEPMDGLSFTQIVRIGLPSTFMSLI